MTGEASRSISSDSGLSKELAEDRPPRASSVSSGSSGSSLGSIRRQESLQINQVGGDDSKEKDRLGLKAVVSRASNRSAVTISRIRTGVSIATNATSDPAFEVDWDEDGDSGNPREWPLLYRSCIIAIVSFSTTSVVMYSTSYSAGIPGMMETFGITNKTLLVLGITTYLLGLAIGSVILAPLSEMYGRRPIYLCAMALFTVLVLPCALAQNLESILVTRFFGALAGSAMISNAPGTVGDIVSDEYRALAFSIWSIGPMNGPVIGPVTGGFVFQYLGWRWTNWVVMCCSGTSLFLMMLVKETYAPTILRKRAAQLRKETGNQRWWCRYDDKAEFWPLLKTNLSRPLIMALTEPICIFWNLYIAVVYAILYLCFVAYPIIFTDLRGWSPGPTGLAYVGIGIGGLIVIFSEPLIRRVINAHAADPATGKPPPEAMVSIVCAAALLIPAGELWFAWTSRPPTPYLAAIAAGIPFGAGNCAVFIYATNYLAHSYGVFAASAIAGNSVLRSVLGGALPLAGPAMYARLGPQWAGTLLGCLELAIVPIPFVFYRYGHRIRERSRLIGEMAADQERLEGKKRAAEERAARRRGREREREERVGGERDLEKGGGLEEAEEAKE
ncbi:putative mfs multidrug transporter protein [Neofusicoccum parvum]|uniref:Mfs multidrug transporter protein n=1 Tax=Neofusicoccum parvum TaxID=310453 RepID=A0ACB5RYY1_9PEZI|nr:putative mfs multidrug transporter protein [Neofusicoccum parvum]